MGALPAVSGVIAPETADKAEYGRVSRRSGVPYGYPVVRKLLLREQLSVRM
jgi:hypothetical protein